MSHQPPSLSLPHFCVLLSIFLFPSILPGQVIIRERVAIEPKAPLAHQAGSIPTGPLLVLDGNTVRTTVPGVIITGSVSISPGTIPNNTGYEVWVNVGGSSHMIQKGGTGYCQDTSAQVSSPFPATLQSCGVIGMTATTFVPAPWQWSCAVRGTNPDTPQVSGNSATFRVTGTLWYTGFEATLTISASLDESYQVTQVIAESQDSTLTCNGSTEVDVAILNGHGSIYTPCGGTQLIGTATINAKGAYAFLVGNGQSGQTVDFAVNNGRGGFLVVLDTSKGIIPKGFDAATITATVNGVNGGTSVALSCQYPPPSVQITTPTENITIEVSSTIQPVITLTEEHSPSEGQFVPSITWDPSNTIATADYYDQIQDSLLLTVRVVADNDGGTARDSINITLKRRGCQDAPNCESPPSPPEVSIKVVSSGFAGFDPCSNPSPSGGSLAGVFFPVIRPPGNLWQPFTVQPCLDRESGRWQFSVSKIEFNAVMDVCSGNLTSWNLVNDAAEVPDQDVCSAIEDLKNHRTYPLTVRTGGYIFKSVLLKHEEAHKKQFEQFMNKYKNAFQSSVLNYQPTCEELASLDVANDHGKKQVDFLLGNYRDDFIGDWGFQTGSIPSDEAKHSANEQTTHVSNNIQKEINDLLLALKTRGQ